MSHECSPIHRCDIVAKTVNTAWREHKLSVIFGQVCARHAAGSRHYVTVVPRTRVSCPVIVCAKAENYRKYTITTTNTITMSARGLRGRVVKAYRFENTPPSPLAFESQECCWFTPRNNVFLQLWKLTSIYNQTWMNNGVKHQFTSPR